MYVVAISRWMLLGIINISVKESCTRNQKKRFMLSNFFSQDQAVYGIMWEIQAHPDRPQVTTYGACAVHAGKLRIETHTQNM
jgi:hypothetical protein